jgi:hypothetical protein
MSWSFIPMQLESQVKTDSCLSITHVQDARHVATQVVAFQVVALLLKEFPDVVRCASRNKTLPVHVALYKGTAIEIVFQLPDIYPESAGIKAKDDELALHIACRTNMSLEIIKRLVEIYPEGIHAKDSESGLALHRACCGFRSTHGSCALTPCL